MIFVTVGTQLTFDRMIEVVDHWAANCDEHVFAQVGETNCHFEHLETVPFLAPDEARRRFAEARCVVAHAGMGTILSALELRKPLIVMPRRADLGEHRNDHQLATARRIEHRGLAEVAWEPQELAERLDRLSEVESGPEIPSEANPDLLAAVARFLSD